MHGNVTDLAATVDHLTPGTNTSTKTNITINFKHMQRHVL